MLRRSILIAAAACALASGAAFAGEPPPKPRGFSALEPVISRMLLGQLGARRAMWSAGDGGRIENNIAIFRQKEDGGAWEYVPVEVGIDSDATPIPATNGAEAMVRLGTRLVVVGSHESEIENAFVAEFDEDVAFYMNGRVLLPGLPIVADNARLRAALNAGLTESKIELIPAGAAERAGLGDEKGRAVSIGGMAVLPEGEALVGLRYPCSADGHPIVVRISTAEALLDPSKPLIAEGAWIIAEAGSRERPAGVRAMTQRDGNLYIVPGSIADEGGWKRVLTDHPEGNVAECSRVEAELPRGASGTLAVSAHVPLGGAMYVEGIAIDDVGNLWGISDSSTEDLMPEMIAK